EETKNRELLQRWLMALDTLPLTLNRFTTELILGMAQRPQDREVTECIVITKMVAFRVGDIGDASLIIQKISDLAKTFDSIGGSKRRNWKKSLGQPATMTISLVAMSEEIPDDPCAVVAKRVEC
ncbi:MAG: hypothetical protein ACFE7R_08255, partial [Candidatus Hodarchaeota archaeon]